MRAHHSRDSSAYERPALLRAGTDVAEEPAATAEKDKPPDEEGKRPHEDQVCHALLMWNIWQAVRLHLDGSAVSFCLASRLLYHTQVGTRGMPGAATLQGAAAALAAVTPIAGAAEAPTSQRNKAQVGALARPLNCWPPAIV